MKWWRGVLAVLAAFIGVRRHEAARGDARLAPWQLVLTAVLLAGGLIAALLLLVSVVTA